MGILRVNQISGDETQLSTLGIGTTTPVTGSVLFDGSGDYLTVGTSNDYIFGTGDYTLECWAYFATLNSENSLASTHNADANWTWKVVSNKLRIYTGTTDVDGTSTIGTSSWFHFAVSRQSSTLRLFVNGINETTTTSTNNYTINNTLHIGAQQNNLAGTYINGYISNLRILKGTALYTANFTPPTLILEPIQDTVLLCCNNPDSAAAVSLAGIGTSKTITVNGNAVASTFNPGLVRNFTSGTQFTGVTRLDTQGFIVPPSGTTEQRNRGRGVFTLGVTPAISNLGVNNINYIEISTSGIAQDFGDLSITTYGTGVVSSSTRGVYSIGFNAPATPSPATVNTLEFITISSTSNSTDFGDLTTRRSRTQGVSSSTRGVYIGGHLELVSPYSGPALTYTNTIDYITIASLGNALDFGDTLGALGLHGNSVCSPTRGVYSGSNTRNNSLEYITIATTGNAQNFGDLPNNYSYHMRGCSASNSTRGLFAGGYAPAINNRIEYITIATLGNGIDFGDLTQIRRSGETTANSIRAVFSGGYNVGVFYNIIDYVLISSTGNALDFGDATLAHHEGAACSDSHGGIS